MNQKESTIMSHSIKGWPSIAAIVLMAWTVTPRISNGAGAEVIYDSAPISEMAASGNGGMQVANAGQKSAPTATDSAPVAMVSDEGSTVSEKINLVFDKPDQDIITRQALEKLNVIIESLEFANADLQNVIRIIGERLNVNFIFDAQDITGKVTLRLHNVRLRDALDSILNSRKLAIVADRSGIFRIVPKEQVGGKSVETKTEVLQFNWVSAQDIQKSLKAFLNEGTGKMEFNEESNTLIVTDVPPQLEIIKDLIKQIDLPERQVLIEARLADVNIGALRNLGTKWSGTTPNKDAMTSIISRTRADGPDLVSGARDSSGNLVNTVLETVTKETFLGGTSLGKTQTTGYPGVKPMDVTPLATAGGVGAGAAQRVQHGKGTWNAEFWREDRDFRIDLRH